MFVFLCDTPVSLSDQITLLFHNNQEKNMQRISVRFPETEISEIERIAGALSEKEGRRVTASEVLRRQQEIGKSVMLFELEPHNIEHCRTLFNSSATIAAAGAASYFYTSTPA